MTITPEELATALGRPLPTAEQTVVIEAPLSPRLVIAGAGSGKTETIAARVVYLVVNGIVRPERILGLTFTRKAASELAGRIRSRLHAAAARGIGGPEIAATIRDSEPVTSTYHAFAGQLITEFGPLAGIEPPARVLSATESWLLARRIVSNWDRDLDTDHGPATVTEDLLSISSALADHLADPAMLDTELARIEEWILTAPPGPRQRNPLASALVGVVGALANRREAVPLVQAFTEAKRAGRLLDFADQMQLAARLVNESPRVGSALRERYGVVLLDEYQDTGHAQRVILRGLFGDPGPDSGDGPPWRGHPVTAVGDPVQSIYSWRGASASNLPRFTSDFPQADGAPAEISPLLISFRNDETILTVANAISAPLRGKPVGVGELRPGPAAGPGTVVSSVHATVSEENRWLAQRLAERYRASAHHDETMAVLVRKRSSMPAIAAYLREAGVPVEVVGVGGLVDEPEVADVIAMLRIVVDHESGPAAVRLLTGARWRLGIADLAALSRRARELSAKPTPPAGTDDTSGRPREIIAHALREAASSEDVDDAGLVDALADPGEPRRYSPTGFERISALGAELRRLRSRLGAPLTDLVAEVVRTLRLDIEVALSPDGRSHLDAFDEVVAGFAGSGPIELLDYLATAGEREDGLAVGAGAPAAGRVQILTVHSAKGLEWDVVALPHLTEGIFPTAMVSTWIGDAAQLPPGLRGDRADLPSLDLSAGLDQKAIGDLIDEHKAAWKERHAVEERRLFYVAATRARHELLLSAHHWTATRKKPASPSDLFTELIDSAVIPHPEPDSPPPDGGTNPELDNPLVGTWPVDPLGRRRAAMERGAALVRAARADGSGRGGNAGGPRSTEGVESAEDVEVWENLGSSEDTAGAEDPGSAGSAGSPEDIGVSDDLGSAEGLDSADGVTWQADAAALLAEREAADRTEPELDVLLPETLSVSALVELAEDPRHLAARLRRPVPTRPAPQARRGTAFHAWVEAHFHGDPLLDIAELPGAHDAEAAGDGELPALVDAFLDSPWAARTPIAVETAFTTPIAGVTVRGRIDAVFADPDGGVTVVDWKTGAVPPRDRAAPLALQLTAYRLAYARLADIPLEKVRATFYYVGARRSITPDDLLDGDQLAAVIDAATVD